MDLQVLLDRSEEFCYKLRLKRLSLLAVDSALAEIRSLAKI